MNDRQFFFQLTGVSMLCAILVYLSYVFLPIMPYKMLGIIGLVFFILLSILIFFWARNAAGSSNLNAFTRLIMINLMIKLFFSILIVAVYYLVVKPQERLFIVPFVIIYFIFTIFEALFLSRLARQK